MSSLNVRISSESHQTLRQLAALEGESMQGVLDKAVETYRRKRFLEQANAAFAALREDHQTWGEEQEERAAWDATLCDGLDDDESDASGLDTNGLEN